MSLLRKNNPENRLAAIASNRMSTNNFIDRLGVETAGQYNANETPALNPLFTRLLPPFAAVAFVALFVSLGMWQLDRAAQKEALESLYADDAPARSLADIDEPVQFERVRAQGTLQHDRQILIDNIVRNGRLGYYVITPLDYANHEPLLLVNRGWIERTAYESGSVALDMDPGRRKISGRIGRLPRAGLQRGNAFMDAGDDWPRIAVYPTTEEVAGELGREVLPHILLLSADEPFGFDRDWSPDVMGPMTHYGYAFQWFAMAFAVTLIAAWQLRKARRAA